MVQATAAALAVALTVIAMPVLAAIPSCKEIQKRAEPYTMKQVRSRMKSMRLPQQYVEYVEGCLRDKK